MLMSVFSFIYVFMCLHVCFVYVCMMHACETVNVSVFKCLYVCAFHLCAYAYVCFVLIWIHKFACVFHVCV